MKALKRIETQLTLLVVAVMAFPVAASSQSRSAHGMISPKLKPLNGQHDFDFEIGTWKTHLRRLVNPLSGSTTWVECDGTTRVSKVWGGRANLVELRTQCPSGKFEGLSLRLYNPQSHQWTLNFANQSDGVMGQPTIGEFKHGRGEFFDQESFKGHMILVRFVISRLRRDCYSFEQAFSDDAGKTWEVNWIATDKRINHEPNKSN